MATTSGPQCLGRIVRYVPKGVWVLPFELPAPANSQPECFLLPIRCGGKAVDGKGGLCGRCADWEAKAAAAAAKCAALGGGGMIPASYHGRITEPIPYWSRLYDGGWFRLKLASGYTVTEENMAKARKAAAEAYAGAGGPPPEPEPQPEQSSEGTGKMSAAGTWPLPDKVPRRKKGEPKKPQPRPSRAKGGPPPPPPRLQKQTILTFMEHDVSTETAAEVVITPIVAAAPPPAPAAAAAAAAAAPKPPSASPKKKAPAAAVKAAEPPTSSVPSPVAIIPPTAKANPVDDVTIISVVSKTIEGKTVHINPETKKVYDLQFKYIGIYDPKKDVIVGP